MMVSHSEKHPGQTPLTRVLVLGGYGLIGIEVMRALAAAGFQPVGFGRSAATGRKLFPGASWIEGDMARMTQAEAWVPALQGIDAVVNCAGALQDGLRDRLEALHLLAIRALVECCHQQHIQRVIQVSVPGAEPGARMPFLATKGEGDAVLRASGVEWTILKPGLVLSRTPYGGTALLRALAAFPLVQPIVLPNARIQTVAVEDVADAVRAVLAGEVPPRRDYELVEAQARTLEQLLLSIRRWAGHGEPVATWRLPRWVGFGLARLADLAGWLGWRSPLRTTALNVLESGVTGNPDAWRAAGGRRLRTLEEHLAEMPATIQERIYGRMHLLFPVLVLVLSGFWISSGLVGAWQLERAVAVLDGVVASGWARLLVVGGAVTDIVLGAVLLVRGWTARVALLTAIVATLYLVAGTWLTPELWADPLGPLVKIFPAIALALAVAALAEER